MAIEVSGLQKRYGSVTVLDDVSFSVHRGEVFGLLGANGAGKTTTLECLEGLRGFDSGTVIVAGCDPRRQERELRRRLGVQLQSSSLPGVMLVSEAIDLVSAWQRHPVPEDLIEQFDVAELLRSQYGKLSVGQQRRVHLVLALCNRPQVVVLDEPTAGLDVQSRAKLHDQIRRIRAAGTTVLLATHDMAEAESLCDRIAILIHHRVAVIGTPNDITGEAISLEKRFLELVEEGKQ